MAPSRTWPAEHDPRVDIAVMLLDG